MTGRRLRAVPAGIEFRPPALPDTWPDAEDRAVTWSRWRPPLEPFICPPPPPYRCHGCGSGEPCSTAQGKLLPHDGETVEVTEVVPSKRRPGREWERTRRRPAHGCIHLVASRCPVCGHTEIYDMHTHTLHIPPWDDPSEVTDFTDPPTTTEGTSRP